MNPRRADQLEAQAALDRAAIYRRRHVALPPEPTDIFASRCADCREALGRRRIGWDSGFSCACEGHWGGRHLWPWPVPKRKHWWDGPLVHLGSPGRLSWSGHVPADTAPKAANQATRNNTLAATRERVDTAYNSCPKCLEVYPTPEMLAFHRHYTFGLNRGDWLRESIRHYPFFWVCVLGLVLYVVDEWHWL
jgi:hypothetical protein